MATLIYVDKENGEPGIHVAPKDGLKLGSVPCKYTGGYQVHRYCESVVGVAWSWGRPKYTLWAVGVVLAKSLQSCPTFCDPMDFVAPPGSAVHGILQARILEWVAIPFARGSS